MITAANITDEQIRSLRDDSHRVFTDACNALAPIGISNVVDAMREVARERCAARLNAQAQCTACQAEKGGGR